mgnify:CR=1 FL=1
MTENVSNIEAQPNDLVATFKKLQAGTIIEKIEGKDLTVDLVPDKMRDRKPL